VKETKRKRKESKTKKKNEVKSRISFFEEASSF
jgi:hypothetical protein